VTLTIMAIDPGTTESAVVFYHPAERSLGVTSFGYNERLLEGLRQEIPGEEPTVVVCEMVQHYGSGLAVGKETFETVRWIGRFEEAVLSRGGRFEVLYRPQIKAQICGSAKAKDGNVRQALVDRFGGDSVALKGKRCTCKDGWKRGREGVFCDKCGSSGWLRRPGPLAGITSHMWAALAVAVTWAELHPEEAR
jgi:hypothetical protein